MNIYVKYRPSTFAAVAGQEAISYALQTQLDRGKVSHAYLLSGTRGTGKTTCARLLAMGVNCEDGSQQPCGVCDTCKQIIQGAYEDVIELDAASRSGVDGVREIKDKARYAPVRGNRKVYIIDEAHQLSPAASNALLKVIEEPPPTTMFIFCTTEPHKILDTIKSRCQLYHFRGVPTAVIYEYIKNVALAEGYEMPDELLRMIATDARGAMRDGLSHLELVMNAEIKSILEFRSIIGRADYKDLVVFLRHVFERNLPATLAGLDALEQELRVSFTIFRQDVVGLLSAILRCKAGVQVDHPIRGLLEELAVLTTLDGIRIVTNALTDRSTDWMRNPKWGFEHAAVNAIQMLDATVVPATMWDVKADSCAELFGTKVERKAVVEKIETFQKESEDDFEW